MIDTPKALWLGLAAASFVPVAALAEVTRHALPMSDFPIARAVEIPADATVVYLSGAVPQVTDEEAPQGSVAAYGDTETQSHTTLEAIEATLSDLDLEMGDVVRMQVYLVSPEPGTPLDFVGFMTAYTEFFGTDEQPNLPARSVFGVASLVNPGWLVEIEVTAVRP